MTSTHALALPAPSDASRTREMADAVAATVARLRKNSGWDPETLAEHAGITCEQVVAIESGRIVPHLRTLWALADAFEVPFGVLLSGAPSATTTFHVLRSADTPVVDSDGGFRTRPLSAAGDPREPEIYELTLAPGWHEDAAPHARDTFEHIVVTQGTLLIRAGESSALLHTGDVAFFRADRQHAYENPGNVETVLHLTMTYAGDWSDASSDLTR